MWEILMIHPRVESSLRYSPDNMVYAIQGGVEAYKKCLGEDYIPMTVATFLLNYDWRGSNRFQEEENLEFLRLYIGRYPEISSLLAGIGPTEWDHE